MRSRAVCLLVLVLTAAGLPAAARAQASTPVRPEAFVAAASGHLFRVEDRTFGDELTVAAGAGVRRGRLGFEVEANRMFGLTAQDAYCGVATCIGSARSGVLSATLASANVLYHFSDGRAQPYVTGGAGAMWTRSVGSIVFSSTRVMTEFEQRNTGFAFNVGGGVRIELNDRLALRPEIRIYDSSIMSSQNLALVRSSIGAAFSW